MLYKATKFNIKMDLKETAYKDVTWIYLAQDRYQ
jgi:hypothetical protein